MSKIQLESLVLKTKDGKQVKLSLVEAEDLYKQLDSLFGTKVTYVPSKPFIIDRREWIGNRPYWYSHPNITPNVVYGASENSSAVGENTSSIALDLLGTEIVEK